MKITRPGFGGKVLKIHDITGLGIGLVKKNFLEPVGPATGVTLKHDARTTRGKLAHRPRAGVFPARDGPLAYPLKTGVGIHARAQRGERGEVVDDEPKARRVRLLGKRASEPVHETDVAKIVHDPAEDIDRHAGILPDINGKKNEAGGVTTVERRASEPPRSKDLRGANWPHQGRRGYRG